MKKTICLTIIFIFLSFQISAFAADSYIELDDFQYSSYVLGEDIIVKGDTDFNYLTLGLYYPNDENYMGYAKMIITITGAELKNGYIIKTHTLDRLWPEGEWHIKLQNGAVVRDVYINLLAEPVYDKFIYVAEYENNSLTSLNSFNARGVSWDGAYTIPISGNRDIKLYFWSPSLAPTLGTNGNIYVAIYENDYLISASQYDASLSASFPIVMKKGDKTYKVFYWNTQTNL